MNRSKRSKSSLFLIELMIAILFFSLGSTICIQAFIKSHFISQSALDLSFASTQVSSAASVLKYTDGSSTSLQEYFPSLCEEDSTYFIYYDEHYKFCEKNVASYILSIQQDVDNVRVDTWICMKDDSGKTIYELTLCYPSYQHEKGVSSYES
ncbi:MAG: hypothetical protein IAA25_03515 [Candidatus Ruminococcus intestinipullorum]|nr:hypothetical protein [Candidatus Ruminococcus intestinipullorum]